MKEDVEERLLDLLCKKAVYGLDEVESRELESLEREHKGSFDFDSIELAVATISMSAIDHKTEMPPNLQSRIVADAERHFDDIETKPRVITDRSASEPTGFTLPSWLGWAVAAAACIVLAFNIYNTQFQRDPAPVAQSTPEPPRPLTPAEQRQQLLQSAGDVVLASFGAGNVKTLNPQGDIVWSDAKQTGYMRLRGLPVNDKSRETYQLWIFDETQDPATPIDGGTFDINSEGEAIVPVNPTLNPRNTKMFAITLEKPGGVVVSKRERIVALAKRDV